LRGATGCEIVMKQDYQIFTIKIQDMIVSLVEEKKTLSLVTEPKVSMIRTIKHMSQN
jgi:hypothetical protein